MSSGVLDMIPVSPSRAGGRALRDRLRLVSGGNPLNLISARGVRIVQDGGVEAAIAIGAALLSWRPAIAGDDDEQLVRGRKLVAAIVGQTILDGLCCGPLFSGADRRDALAWAEEMELLLKVGPCDDDDEEDLEQLAGLAVIAGLDLHDLSGLLRVCFAHAHRDPPINLPDWADLDLIYRRWTQVDLFDDLPEAAAMRRPSLPRSATRAKRDDIPLPLGLEAA